jgi:hypothetical protein
MASLAPASSPAPVAAPAPAPTQAPIATKYAFLVGINYKGTSSELRGCINDVHNMSAALVKYFRYDPANIVVITDETDTKPTHANILAGLKTLCTHAGATQVFFHYSGHGSYQRDRNGDESDGQDECICPLDYEQSGFIVDDDLYALLDANLAPSCRFTGIFDSCFSGTVLDLPYRYVQKRGGEYERTEPRSKSLESRTVIEFSGCTDRQTSADAYLNGQSCGALTAAFMALFAAHNGTEHLTMGQTQVALNTFLESHRFQQRSELTVSNGKSLECRPQVPYTL